jgi:O-antigen/teichoic acid export membrane protein
VPGSVSFWVIASSDRIIVGVLAGPTELGYYAVSTSVVAVFAVLLVAVGQAWLPRIVQLYEEDREQSEIVAGKVFTVLVLILAAMAAAISLLAPFIISIVSGPDYAPAAQSLPLLALGAVLFGTTVLTGNGLELGKRTKELAVVAVTAAVVNVTAALILVPTFGSLGAATASVLGYATLTGLFLARSRAVWRMHLNAPALLATLAAIVAIVLVQTARLSGTI